MGESLSSLQEKQLRANATKKNNNVASNANNRRMRQFDAVPIRKAKNEESLEKTREDEDLELSPTLVLNKLQNLQQFVAMVMSQNPRSQLEATTELGILLSLEHDAPVQPLIDARAVPRFVEFLMRSNLAELQIEAARVLKYIAGDTSKGTKVVVDSGAVPLLVHLLSNPNQNVRHQAVIALGNIAGDSAKYRDIVLAHGSMAPLLSHFNAKLSLDMVRKATWTLANFCRKPLPPFNQVKAVLPRLAKLIESTDDEVLIQTCETLLYLSAGSIEYIQGIVEAGVCQRIVQLLQQPSLVSHALQIVGGVVAGDDDQTKHIIGCGALPCLYSILRGDHSKCIKKDACWLVSNITAGSKQQIQAVINAGIIDPLVSLISEADFEVKKEATWAISNAIVGGNSKQIKYIAERGCIIPLCNLLACTDTRTVRLCLESLAKILNVGEVEKSQNRDKGINIYASYLEDVEGLEKLEALFSHENPEIYDLATNIVEKYFNNNDDEPLVPNQATFFTGVDK